VGGSNHFQQFLHRTNVQESESAIMSHAPDRNPAKKAKSASSGKAANKQRDMIVRAVIYGVLVIVLVLALIDYMAKKKATDTINAWRDAKKATDAIVEEKDMKEITESDLEPLVVGSPSKESITISGREQARSRSKEKVVYNWGGIFRTYTATIYIGPGKHRPIEEILGPGETLDLE